MADPYFQDEHVTLYLGDWRELDADALGSPELVLTDPPYGETNLKWDRWPDRWPSVLLDKIPDLSQMWCFGSTRMFLDHGHEFEGWKLAQDVVWSKPRGRSTETDRFSRSHELALHWYRGLWRDLHRDVPRVPSENLRKGSLSRGRGQVNDGTRVKPIEGKRKDYEDDGLRIMRTVIASGPANVHANIHPTQKPLGVLEPLIRYSCRPGGTVLDIYAGSGSTLDAARNVGRRAVGVEADEQYIERAALRLSQRAFMFEEE